MLTLFKTKTLGLFFLVLIKVLMGIFLELVHISTHIQANAKLP